MSLDLAPSVKERYKEAGHAKALAILALRKKGISKVDPNEQRIKDRKEDIKEKVKKRMRSEEDEGAPENCGGAKKPKVEKTVTVFGKEVSVEKLEEIRNKKSVNTRLVEEADLDAADKYFFIALALVFCSC